MVFTVWATNVPYLKVCILFSKQKLTLKRCLENCILNVWFFLLKDTLLFFVVADNRLTELQESLQVSFLKTSSTAKPEAVLFYFFKRQLYQSAELAANAGVFIPAYICRYCH